METVTHVKICQVEPKHFGLILWQWDDALVCLFPVVAQGTCEEGAIGSDQALVHDELLHRWASAYIDTDAWRADVTGYDVSV
jgi:hypothetical protein